jgi:hypothetical protein
LDVHNRTLSGIKSDKGIRAMKPPTIVPGQDLVKLIAEIDEFIGRWDAGPCASHIERNL